MVCLYNCFWLNKLMPIAKYLFFKGGTSLSKSWKLINSFSEDIDLAIDKDFFGFTGELGKNYRDKLRKKAGAYANNTFFEELNRHLQKNDMKNLEFLIKSGQKSVNI